MAQFALRDDRISFQLLQKLQISQLFRWFEQIRATIFHTSMATYVNLRTFLNIVHGMNIQEKKNIFPFAYNDLQLRLKTCFISDIRYGHFFCNHCAISDIRLEYNSPSLLIFVRQKAFFSAIRKFSIRLFSSKSRFEIAFAILSARTSA